jgi:hypothetical protein
MRLFLRDAAPRLLRVVPLRMPAENTSLAYAAFLRLPKRDQSATVLGTGDKPSTEEDHE